MVRCLCARCDIIWWVTARRICVAGRLLTLITQHVAQRSDTNMAIANIISHIVYILATKNTGHWTMLSISLRVQHTYLLLRDDGHPYIMSACLNVRVRYATQRCTCATVGGRRIHTYYILYMPQRIATRRKIRWSRIMSNDPCVSDDFNNNKSTTTSSYRAEE